MSFVVAPTRRRNVVVIADEAHRSLCGFKANVDAKTGEISYGFAKYLRDALLEIEVVEYLKRASKMNHTASLKHGERGDLNGNETVLAKGQAETRVPDDIESKFAIAPGVSQLMRWGSPQGNAAEDEESGVVGDLLLAIPAFLVHEANGIELFDLLLSETELWKY
jgi:hypothetical protein